MSPERADAPTPDLVVEGRDLGGRRAGLGGPQFVPSLARHRPTGRRAREIGPAILAARPEGDGPAAPHAVVPGHIFPPWVGQPNEFHYFTPRGTEHHRDLPPDRPPFDTRSKIWSKSADCFSLSVPRSSSCSVTLGMKVLYSPSVRSSA